MTAPNTNGQEVAVNVVARIDSLVSGMDKAAESVGTATASMQASFAALGSIIDTVMAPLVALLVAFEGFRKVKDAIDAVVDSTVALEKLSAQTGITIESLQELEFAAKDLDVPTDALATGLQHLSLQMEQAAESSKGQAGTAFHALGIEVRNTNGTLKDSGEIFDEIREKFSQMADGPTKGALAMNLFGRSGQQLIPILNMTTQQAEALRQKMELMQGDFKNAADTENEYHNATTTLKESWDGLTKGIIDELLPALTFLVQGMTSLINLFEAAAWGAKSMADWILGDFDEAGKAIAEMTKHADAARDAFKLDKTPPKKTGNTDILPNIDVSQMTKWEQEWNEKVNAWMAKQGHTEQGLIDQEIAFWYDITQNTTKGSADYIAAYAKLIAAKQKDATYDEQSAEAAHEKLMAQAKGDLPKMLDLAQQWAQAQAALFGVNSPQSQKAFSELARVQNEITQSWESIFKVIPDAFKDSLFEDGAGWRELVRLHARHVS